MLPLAKTGHTHTDTRGIGVRVRVSRKHETRDTLSDSTLAVHTFRPESAYYQCQSILFQLTNMSSHSFETPGLTFRPGLVWRVRIFSHLWENIFAASMFFRSSRCLFFRIRESQTRFLSTTTTVLSSPTTTKGWNTFSFREFLQHVMVPSQVLYFLHKSPHHLRTHTYSGSRSHSRSIQNKQ